MTEGLAEERKVTSIVEKGISNLGGGEGSTMLTALFSFVIRFMPLKPWNLLCTIFHCCITSMIIFSDVIL